MKHAADYTLQVAAELERLGRTFYDSLALGCGNARIAALAASLAKAEEEHVATFVRMRQALPRELRGPNLSPKELAEAVGELRARVMPNGRTVREAVLSTDLGKTLEMAIDMEAGVVAFYSELAADFAQQDAEILTEIVNEEREHLAMLREVHRILLATSAEA